MGEKEGRRGQNLTEERERSGESWKEERKKEEGNREDSFLQTVEEIWLQSETEVCRRGGGAEETEEIEARGEEGKEPRRGERGRGGTPSIG